MGKTANDIVGLARANKPEAWLIKYARPGEAMYGRHVTTHDPGPEDEWPEGVRYIALYRRKPTPTPRGIRGAEGRLMAEIIPYEVIASTERGLEWRVPLWDAIHEYVVACGGSVPTSPTPEREDAVVKIEAAIRMAMEIAIEEHGTDLWPEQHLQRGDGAGE